MSIRRALRRAAAALVVGTLSLASAREAAAQEADRAGLDVVRVHIDSPEPVDLEAKVGADWVRICASPCDAAIPRTGLFRINGSGIRTSKPFRLDAHGDMKLSVEPASSTTQAIGITLVLVGGAGLLPAVGVTGLVLAGVAGGAVLVCPIVTIFGANYFGCVGSIGKDIGALYAKPFVWIPAAAGLIPIVGGGAWLAASPNTRVTPTAAAGFTRTPEWRAESEVLTTTSKTVRPIVPIASFAF